MVEKMLVIKVVDCAPENMIYCVFYITSIIKPIQVTIKINSKKYHFLPVAYG